MVGLFFDGRRLLRLLGFCARHYDRHTLNITFQLLTSFDEGVTRKRTKKITLQTELSE